MKHGEEGTHWICNNPNHYSLGCCGCKPKEDCMDEAVELSDKEKYINSLIVEIESLRARVREARDNAEYFENWLCKEKLFINHNRNCRFAKFLEETK